MNATAGGMEALSPRSQLAESAAVLLKERLDTVAGLLGSCARRGRCGPKRVHRVRVAVRRAEATIGLLSPFLDEGRAGKARKKLSRRLRRIRRGAGCVRDCDVHLDIVEKLRGTVSHAEQVAADFIAERLEAQRRHAQRHLVGLAKSIGRAKLARGRRRLVESLARRPQDAGPAVTLLDAAREALAPVIAAVRACAGGDLAEMERLHSLRLAIKRLRYGVEVIAPTLGEAFVGRTYRRLADLQERLGDVNDAETFLALLESERAAAASPPQDAPEAPSADDGTGTPTAALQRAGLDLLVERFVQQRDARRAGFLEWWRSFPADAVLEELESAITSPLVTPGAEGAGAPDGAAGAHGTRAGVVPALRGARPSEERGPCRLAAIDVGSNTTRLVIAEAYRDGALRILDDERELTRLARGVSRTGRLDPAVMERVATTIARVRSIAEGYNCAAVRAIATAAVREAENRREFVDLVRARAGVELEVISASQEARLAHQSVMHSFGDLGNLNAGVVDLGGGSTEVVLSSRGMIDEVYAIATGAVSLTERFGGPERAAGKQFGEMRRWVRAEVRRKIGWPPMRPELLVGTGGTITALASIAMKRDRSVPAGEGAAPTTVQGYQMSREEVGAILDDLLDMSLEERVGVPGLNADRADIIVAGVTILEEVMKHLGVRRLRVHDLGVRKGLLLEMMREAFGAPDQADRPEGAGSRRLAAARRLARTCRYEEAHSEHVAILALQILDALGPLLPEPETLWSQPVTREILEAGAVLHDIGYVVNYAAHHRHAYHLIMHSDLADGAPGLSRRELELVANVVRYHRRSEPRKKHPNLAALSEADRRLVRSLAAVLRIADGLDRTHTQNVRSVRVRLEAGAAVFELDAPDDPANDAWGAARKSGLFHKVFGLEPRFQWRGARVENAATDEQRRQGTPAAEAAHRNGHGRAQGKSERRAEKRAARETAVAK